MKFRLGKITHHQTVMLELLSYLPRQERLNLTWTTSNLSRAYAAKVLNIGLNLLGPTIENLRRKNFTKKELMLPDKETNVPLLLHFMNHGTFKGHLILACLDGTMQRFDRNFNLQATWQVNPKFDQITTLNMADKDFALYCSNGDLHIIDIEAFSFVQENNDKIPTQVKEMFYELG